MERKVKEEELDHVLKELSKPENLEALKKIVNMLPTISEALKPLDEIVESGTLDTIVRIACLINIFRQMITDEMISGFSSLGSSALDC